MEKKNFLNTWDDNRKKSLYQLIGFGIFFLFAFLFLIVGRTSTDNNTNNEINEPSIDDVENEIREVIHQDIIENFSFSFTLKITTLDEVITYEGKRYQNKILATNHINETYYLENDTTYAFNKETKKYDLTEDNVYLKEFSYEQMAMILAVSTLDSSQEMENGKKRTYHFEDNQIETIETNSTLEINITMDDITLYIKYDDINKIEDFSVL